jgi:hypothetical protein
MAISTLIGSPERSHALPINAIAQSSFETDDGSWTRSNAFSSFCVAPGGNTGPCWALVGGYGFVSQTLSSAVPGDQVTQLSLYATVWSGNVVPPCCGTSTTLEVIVGYTDGSSASVQQFVQGLDQWQFFDFTSIIDPNRVISSVELTEPVGGYLGIDDVSLQFEPVPEPSTFLLIGFGLLGLVWSRQACRPTRCCS